MSAALGMPLPQCNMEKHTPCFTSKKQRPLTCIFFELLVDCPGGILKLYRDIMYVKVSGATGKPKWHAYGLFPSNKASWTGLLKNVIFAHLALDNIKIKFTSMVKLLMKEVHFNALKYL